MPSRWVEDAAGEGLHVGERLGNRPRDVSPNLVLVIIYWKEVGAAAGEFLVPGTAYTGKWYMRGCASRQI